MNASELEAVPEDSGPMSEDCALEIRNGSFKWEVLPEAERPKGVSAPGKTANVAAAAMPKSEATAATIGGAIPMADTSRIHLRNINLKVKRGSLVAVIGGVGR